MAESINHIVNLIKTAFKIPLLKSFYCLSWPQVLPINYTFVISTQCNSRCKTCNVWKQQPHDELTLKEWRKIFKSIGQAPFWITISGGEPFLQPHLIDFCRLIFEICQPAILNIPTNCLTWKTIPQKTEEILKASRGTSVIINLSLDGVGEKHDEIRGVVGNFEAFEKTYRNIKKLQPTYQNLTVGIHSVISKLNVNHTDELFSYVARLSPDQYLTEIAEERVELNTIGSDITPEYNDYSIALNNLPQPTHFQNKKLPKLTQKFRQEYYQLVKQWLEEKRQIIPCYAGVASCQISSRGEVWPCCIRGDNLGNLKDHNYDFKRIWFSEKANKVRKSIKKGNCSCPLANAAYTNVLLNLTTAIKVAFKKV